MVARLGFAQNTLGRLAVVQYSGAGTTDQSFTEWYGYTAAGLRNKKRLQVMKAA